MGGFEFEAGVESASVMYTARVGIGEDSTYPKLNMRMRRGGPPRRERVCSGL